MRIRIILQFLQENAEWVCAIAIVIFAAMQWGLSRSQFMYLLNGNDLKHYDIFQALLEELFKKPVSFNEIIPLYRKCLMLLDVALLNADYGIRKHKKVKKHKTRVYI